MPGAGLLASLDACPTAAFVLDAAGTIVHANPEARRLFYTHEQLDGLPMELFLTVWPMAQDMPRCPIVDGSGHERRACVRTSRWQGRSGEMMTVFIEVERIEQQETPAAEIRLRSILDMLPQAVCLFDSEDRYVLWNQKYAELYSDIARHLRPGIPFEEILKISLAGDEMRELIEDKETWLVERMEKFRLPAAQEEQQLRDGRWLRHDDRRTPDGGAIGMRVNRQRDMPPSVIVISMPYHADQRRNPAPIHSFLRVANGNKNMRTAYLFNTFVPARSGTC